MKAFGRYIQASFLVILVTLFASLAWGQDNPAGQTTDQTADPPGRVARVDYMQGQVSVQPHGTDDWVQAESNRPLTIADNVWADKDSRAELDFGTGFMRINSETSLTLTNVNNDVIQVSLHQGALNVHVRKLYSGETWEVDTPNMAYTLSKAGDYRFDVDPNSDSTRVVVWRGSGEATGQGQAVRVDEGQAIQFSNGTSMTHEALNATQPDGFDQWCEVRDKRLDQSVSARHVAPGVVGADDLDQYGAWKDTPDYGPVWVPTSVAPDWAPYTNGNWIWEEPWGWTWVDAYPWGFAPFHYGRWVSWGGGWGWAPGPYWVRPWYAPALVAWWGGPGWGVGFGWGWGFGAGFGGGFGWCPLGWGEPFFPWYHGGPGYFRNVNISNTRITNINNISNNYFRNGGVGPLYGRNGVGMPRYFAKPGAVTAMSRSGLEHGLAVRGNSVHPTPEQMRGASSLGRVEANPTREATLGGRGAGNAARPSSSAFSRPTVSHLTPPAASRGSFSHAGETAARNPGNPAARGPETSAGRGPEASANRNTPGPAGRSVPRPPSSFNSGSAARGMNGEPSARNVPRPPSAGGTARNESSQVASNRNVPRPPSSMSSSRTSEGNTARPTESGRSSMPTYNSSRNVPRPTGAVKPASHSYASSGSYSGRNYGGSSGYGSRWYGYSGSRGGSYSAPRSSGSFGGSHSSGGFHGSSGGGFHSSGGGGFHGGGGGGGSHGGGGGGFHGGGHR
jgi:uncharacterized protein DUF6600/FecR-like protein